MPISYKIHPERRLVVTVLVGVITIQEVRVHSKNLICDPAFDPNFSQIIDATQKSSCELTVDDMREIATNPRFADRTRHAIVVLNRMDMKLAAFMAIHDETGQAMRRVQIFTDYQSALNWLGQEEDAIGLLNSQ